MPNITADVLSKMVEIAYIVNVKGQTTSRGNLQIEFMPGGQGEYFGDINNDETEITFAATNQAYFKVQIL